MFTYSLELPQMSKEQMSKRINSVESIEKVSKRIKFEKSETGQSSFDESETKVSKFPEKIFIGDNYDSYKRPSQLPEGSG